MTEMLGEIQRREVTWHDPAASLERAATMSGLEYMHAIASGELPLSPIAELMNFTGGKVDEGFAEFHAMPDASMLNPLGIVHGGAICTLLDSVLGCAVHTTLPAGVGYASIDINVSYLRPPAAGTELIGRGRVTKPGRRVAFAEGEIVDPEGKLIATATGSCLVFGS
jgi:uncharacterized protein (TIGR00369 family)